MTPVSSCCPCLPEKDKISLWLFTRCPLVYLKSFFQRALPPFRFSPSLSLSVSPGLLHSNRNSDWFPFLKTYFSLRKEENKTMVVFDSDAVMERLSDSSMREGMERLAKPCSYQEDVKESKSSVELEREEEARCDEPPVSSSSSHRPSFLNSPSLLSEVCEIPAFLSLLTSADVGRLATVSRCCHEALHKHPPPPLLSSSSLDHFLPSLYTKESITINPPLIEDQDGRRQANQEESPSSPCRRRLSRSDRKKHSIRTTYDKREELEEGEKLHNTSASPSSSQSRHSLSIRSAPSHHHHHSRDSSSSSSSLVLLCPHLRVRGRRIHQWLPSIHWGVVRSLDCTKSKSRSLQETQMFLSMALRLCCTYSSRALRHVNLSMNGLSAATAPALANLMRVCPKLEELDLTYNRLGDTGALILAEEGLPYCQSLEVLILNDNRIGNRGAAALLQALSRHTRDIASCSSSSVISASHLNSSSLPSPSQSSPLRRLYLQDNFITSPFLRETATSILATSSSSSASYPALKKLFLGGNHLSDIEDLRVFLKALCTSGNFNLKVVVLRKNALPSSPALEMCKSILDQATRYGAKSLACGLMMLDLTQGCASNFTALVGGVRLAA